MGFVCPKCGTPLAIKRADGASKAGDQSTRGLTRSLYRLWAERVLRARNHDGTDHGFTLTHHPLNAWSAAWPAISRSKRKRSAVNERAALLNPEALAKEPAG